MAHRELIIVSFITSMFGNWVIGDALRTILQLNIVETAKENGLNPYTYLECLFEEMPNMDVSVPSDLERLLPWSKELPVRCKSQQQK